MNRMIENCARAICIKNGFDPNELCYYEDEVKKGPKNTVIVVYKIIRHNWELYIDEAVCVLKMLRDITPEFTLHKFDKDWVVFCYNWQEIIDETICEYS